MIKRSVTVLLILLATVSGVMINPGSAEALSPTCSQWSCDNTDPISTHCADSANDTGATYIRNGAGQPLAYLELRWGIVCHTNWGKITKQAYGNYINVRVYRESPYFNTATYGGFAASYYGDQVYGYNMRACAVGQATDITNPQSPVYQAIVCG